MRGSVLSISFVEPQNEIDPRKQMEQIPATRHNMCDYKTWTHFPGVTMFIPGA